MQELRPACVWGELVPAYTTMPSAKASPAAGGVPDGTPNVPVWLATITTSLPAAFAAKARSIAVKPAAVAENEAGSATDTVKVSESDPWYRSSTTVATTA